MGITLILFIFALIILVCGIMLLVQGIKGKSTRKIALAVISFLVLIVGYFAFGSFITSM